VAKAATAARDYSGGWELEAGRWTRLRKAGIAQVSQRNRYSVEPRQDKFDFPQVQARSSSENPPELALHKAGLPAVARSMGAGRAKLYWPLDQFLRC